MKIERININNIPAIIWGEKSNKVFIAVHGNLSHKEDVVIKILADIAVSKGYQVLSFDLPEHGDRKGNTEYLCIVQNCIEDLKQVISYAKENYEELNVWGCSMGAYFSLLTYNNETINKCLFLSPVLNMQVIIENMMKWSNITEEELKEKQEIKTEFGFTLYWNYYQFVKSHPIENWDKDTSILYGSKDNLQDESLLKEFASKFNCNLTILENEEHFFHTEQQLFKYRIWLENVIK